MMTDTSGSHKGIFALPNEVSRALSHSTLHQRTHGLTRGTRSSSTSSTFRPPVNSFLLLQRAVNSTHLYSA